MRRYDSCMPPAPKRTRTHYSSAQPEHRMLYAFAELLFRVDALWRGSFGIQPDSSSENASVCPALSDCIRLVETKGVFVVS